MEDALILARAVNKLLAADVEAARAELRQLPVADPIPRERRRARTAIHKPPRIPRVPVPKPVAANVYLRDNWRCHYCGRRVVASVVIELVGRLCPVEFPFPPGHHMPKGRAHPAAERVYPNVDHVMALAIGGSAVEMANLVTACTPCNEEEGDRLGWERVELERDDWDGLSSNFGALLAIAAIPPTSTHRAWSRAFEARN